MATHDDMESQLLLHITVVITTIIINIITNYY